MDLWKGFLKFFFSFDLQDFYLSGNIVKNLKKKPLLSCIGLCVLYFTHLCSVLCTLFVIWLKWTGDMTQVVLLPFP